MQEKSDAQLLHDYADRGEETAFAEIVSRHADLIYSAALRQLDSPDLAADVAQGVFVDLARKAAAVAGSLAADASLIGWLYRAVRYASLNQLRTTRRRVANERQAMEQLLTNSESSPEWERIRPTLDEAMADLDDEDREALLLRYFKNLDFRAVGKALGVSDDTAQKRVSRAVEQLRKSFSKRGIPIGAGGLAIAISANAVQAAPVGLALGISTAATLAAASATSTATTAITLTKIIAMTTLQKILIGAALVAAVGTGVYESRKAADLVEQNQSLRRKQISLEEQVKQLQSEREGDAKKLASLSESGSRSNANELELLRLRGEVSRLRNEKGQGADTTQLAAKSWINRVAQLKQHLQETPGANIPELSLLGEEDWLAAVKDTQLATENQYRRAMSTLRMSADNKFGQKLSDALHKLLAANGNRFPADLTELKPYFDEPIDDALFQRWEITSSKTVPNVGVGSTIITEKSAVDDVLDSRLAIGARGYGSTDFLGTEISSILYPVYDAFHAANPNPDASMGDPSQLMPYAKTPEQQAAVGKMIERVAVRK